MLAAGSAVYKAEGHPARNTAETWGNERMSHWNNLPSSGWACILRPLPPENISRIYSKDIWIKRERIQWCRCGRQQGSQAGISAGGRLETGL